MALLGMATLLVVSSLYAPGTKAAYGTEFQLMFMDNFVEELDVMFLDDTQENFLAVSISNPADDPTPVNVFMPHNDRFAGMETTLNGKSSIRVPIPLYAMHRGSGKDVKGIKVNSTLPVSVIGINKQEHSTDTFLAIPRESLGVSYTAACFIANIRTQIGFTATLDDTNIALTLPSEPEYSDIPDYPISVESEGRHYTFGDRLTVKLNAHETYLLTTRGDLTGTQIRSSKRISVFSGNVRARLNGLSRDHLVEQLVPLYAWGTQHYSTSTPRRGLFDDYRILVKYPETTFYLTSNDPTYDGITDTVSSPNSFATIRVASGVNVLFNCTKPCFVYQVSASTMRTVDGDPSMLTIPEVSHWQDNYSFNTPKTSENTYYTNIVTVIMDNSDELVNGLDGVLYSPSWSPLFSGSSMKTAEVEINTGNNRLISQSRNTFYAVIYGATDRESYANPLGMYFQSPACLNSRAVMLPGDGVDNDCDSFIDEEMINGIDDDGDGQIDEDAEVSRINFSSGREYVLMFMENRVEAVNNIPMEIFIGGLTDTDPTNVTVIYYLFEAERTIELLVHPREVHKIEIDASIMQKGTNLDFKAVRISSNNDIVVYGMNKEQYSADGFLALPVATLGKEYYTVSFHPATTGTEFSVIAVNDSTAVTITFPRVSHSFEGVVVQYDGNTYVNEDSFIVMMQEFQTLQIQTAGGNRGDLSGTYIRSDKPVAVFSGNIRTYVETGVSGNSRDHLVEQMPPVKAYGKTFATMTTPDRTIGDVYKIVSSTDNTTLRICQRIGSSTPSCYNEILNGKGTHVLLDITESDVYMFITASAPVLMVQVTRSQAFVNGRLENADPAMVVIPPVEQYSNNYTFLTPTVSNPAIVQDYIFHWCMIIIEADKTDGLIIDGNLTALLNVVWEPIPDCDLVAGSFELPFALHFLSHSDPTATFMGLLYGVADRESYAFPIGLRLDDLHLCVETPMTDGDGIDNDCDNAVDEEICDNGIDDDNDGRQDEDCTVLPSIYSYFIVFMENRVEHPLGYPMRLFATPSVDQTVRIRTPKYTYNDGQTYDRNILVLATEGLEFGLRSEIKHYGSGISNVGVWVQSDYPITLYGSNKEKFSHDAFLVLERSLLGNRYRTLHYAPPLLAEQFAVTPVEDNTLITVELPLGLAGQVDFNGMSYVAGEIFTFTLDIGDSAQIQAKYGGLSGTIVTGSDDFALFSGNIRTFVGNSRSRDNLVEQLLPESAWADEYLSPTTPDRTENDVFLFVTSAANSLIQVTSSDTGIMTPYSIRGGEHLEINLPTDGVNYKFESLHTFQAVRVTRSQTSFTELADPALMLLIPNDNWPTRVSFSPPVYSGGESGGEYNNTLQVLISDAKKSGIMLNGKALEAEWTTGADPTYSLAEVQLANTETMFTLEHNENFPFMAYLYGSADRESYALPLGISEGR